MLLDQDDDGLLRRISLGKDGDWYEGDIKDDLWNLLKKCLPMTLEEAGIQCNDPEVAKNTLNYLKLNADWIDAIEDYIN